MCGYLPCGAPPRAGRHISPAWLRPHRMAPERFASSPHLPAGRRRGRWPRWGETGRVDEGSQAVVAARVPGAAALGLVAPRTAAVVPAISLADAEWMSG